MHTCDAQTCWSAENCVIMKIKQQSLALNISIGMCKGFSTLHLNDIITELRGLQITASTMLPKFYRAS